MSSVFAVGTLALAWALSGTINGCDSLVGVSIIKDELDTGNSAGTDGSTAMGDSKRTEGKVSRGDPANTYGSAGMGNAEGTVVGRADIPTVAMADDEAGVWVPNKMIVNEAVGIIICDIPTERWTILGMAF